MEKVDIVRLAEDLADGYGEYYQDTESMFPIHFFICEDDGEYYVEGQFSGTPNNAVAYIGELKEASALPGETLKANAILEFIEDIENADWE